MTRSSKARWWPRTAGSSTPACSHRGREMQIRTAYSTRFASPLRGRGRGGGNPDGKCSAIPPSPALPHKGGGRSARCRVGFVAFAALTLLPHTALAAGGDDVSPLVYQFMVFVI